MKVSLTGRQLALGLAGLGVAVVLGVSGGVVPLKASTGHWKVTEMVLGFAMKRSVWTWSRALEIPEVDHEGVEVLGAGIYENSCAMCHGRPGRRAPLREVMLPPPPDLQERTNDPRSQFLVVKHGVRFTGMPAFPAVHRDDEVAAVVELLQRFPEMSPEEYDALVYGPAPEGPPELGLERCVGCHGQNGRSRSELVPVIEGQPREWLEATLRAYAENERESGAMESVAASLSGEERAALARWYASRPPRDVQLADDGRGRSIALHGIPERRIGSCVDCHGPGPDHNPVYPRLAGQNRAYLENQLRLFQRKAEEERRGGTVWSDVMEKVLLHGLTEEEIGDVSAWYAGEAP